MIGNYHLVRPLEGGRGDEVSLYEKDNVLYAIKRVSMIHPQEALSEISLYTILSHPHIIEPYEIIPGTDTLNVVMKYIPDTVKARDLDINDLRLVVWQLLSAIGYMHSNGITHGDLHPGNILLESDSMSVCIIDFGESIYMPIGGQLYSFNADILDIGELMYQVIYKKESMERHMALYSEDMQCHHEIRRVIIDEIRNDTTLPTDARDVLSSLMVMPGGDRIDIRKIMSMPWFSGMLGIRSDTINLPTYQKVLESSDILPRSIVHDILSGESARERVSPNMTQKIIQWFREIGYNIYAVPRYT